MFTSVALTVIFSTVVVFNTVSGFIITTSDDGPVVRGATIQFKVEVFDDNGNFAKNHFIYDWIDKKFPKNNVTFETDSPVSNWSLRTDSKYIPGIYQVEVKVSVKHNYIVIDTTTVIEIKTFNFHVTKTLNGEFVLSQGNSTRNKFVASSTPVNQSIALKTSDLEYINKTKNYVRSFWFVDCIYYGQRNGYDFDFNFTKSELRHLVQALVIATDVPVNFTLPSPLVSNSSSSIKNASISNNGTEVWDPDKPFKDWLIKFNATHLRGNNSSNYTDTCLSLSNIPLNNDYAYGLFSTNFTVKDPVVVSPINGTNWLQDGEILNITVSCTGSSPYKYCLMIFPGLYNVTGKEVCEREHMIKNCSFNIQHLFTEATQYTIVVFLSNSVTEVVKPIAVTIYKVTRHPQLSVIIVPVVFSIVAVILVIFGVAYYVQSKRSYTVEVADFDFANQSTDMEYKSFRERLRESVSNLFLKSNDFNDEDDEQIWSSNRKYGSMQ